MDDATVRKEKPSWAYQKENTMRIVDQGVFIPDIFKQVKTIYS